MDSKPSGFFSFGVATSLVLFGFDGNRLKILTVQKDSSPFKNAKVLPSYYIEPSESIEQVTFAIMKKFTQTEYAYLEQLKAFAKVFRNPEGRVINVAYYALVKLNNQVLQNTQRSDAEWVDYGDIPDLAFDHNEIVEYAKERLKRRVKRRPIGFHLLPEEFTILQLQKLYEQALNKGLDKRNFRKKIFKSKLIIETGNVNESAKKPSKLYRFDEEKYEKLTLKGYDFLF